MAEARRAARRRPAPGDLIAGLTVALVLIPQALAYAKLAGMPPAHGLYAAGIPLLVAAPVADMWRHSRPAASIAVGTFVATLAFAPRIERGVLVGVGLSVAIHLWRELRVDHDTWQEEGVLHIRPRGVLWFGAAQILEGIVLTELARHPDARGLELHLDGIGRLDITAALTLRSVMDEARRGGMDVGLTGVEERDRRLVDGVVRDVPARRHP